MPARRIAAAAVIHAVLCLAPAARAQQTGVRFVGRWLPPATGSTAGGPTASGPTANYAGSAVQLHFRHSSSVSADLNVFDTKGEQRLFVSVSVDGGKPVRVGLQRGNHPGVVLAAGLSDGAHLVSLRKEGEPYFGALQFKAPTLDVAGRWLPIDDDRPIIEVIGDSDATGICVLGPDSPQDPVSIRNPEWAAQSLSWPGLLEAGLAAVGHPADVVDLAISGSTTASEADTYDYTAPGFSSAKFDGYGPPGRKFASVVLLWGGGNDRHGGGDVAVVGNGRLPSRYAELSAFQRGVFDQVTKIFARNPAAKIVMLDYIDPTLPDWQTAYDQVRSLFSAEQRQRLYFLRVHVLTGKQDACEVDPRGHPNVSLHATWAAQILTWMLSPEVFGALGFPGGWHWGDL